MTFRITNRSDDRDNYLTEYKCKGKRRLIAVLPKEEEVYIDSRNLWKASTIPQEKQYDSIRKSGLLSSNRMLTFLKFNYRYAEERDLCYTDVFKLVDTNKPPSVVIQRNTQRKLKRELNQLNLKVIDEVKSNRFNAEKDWLQQYHQSEKIDDFPFRKQKQITMGTMNVNDLWGQKQLQESLGFLPCKRDRPKMLKFYSSKLKMRKIKTEAQEALL